MTTNSSEHSRAVEEYVAIELDDSFEFEDRLSPNEDDPIYDAERVVLDDSEDETH